jgi:hypothetical protein
VTLRFAGTPDIDLARVLGGAASLASEGRPPCDGTSSHVLLMLALAMPRVAAATGVGLTDLRAAADAGPRDRDYAFGPGDLVVVTPSSFLAGVLADPGTEAGRLAATWGWTRRDVTAVAAAADATVPVPLPGWTLG